MAEMTIQFSDEDVKKIKALGEGEEFEVGSYFFVKRFGKILKLFYNSQDTWIADMSIFSLSAENEYNILQC